MQAVCGQSRKQAYFILCVSVLCGALFLLLFSDPHIKENAVWLARLVCGAIDEL